MDNLSYKAKIIYAAMDNLGAKGKDNKITSYAILDYIVEESEVLQEHELVKDIPEDKYVDFTIDVNIKSINTILTSLAKKNIITKTEPMNLKIDGVTRNLRQYYLKYLIFTIKKLYNIYINKKRKNMTVRLRKCYRYC